MAGLGIISDENLYRGNNKYRRESENKTANPHQLWPVSEFDHISWRGAKGDENSEEEKLFFYQKLFEHDQERWRTKGENAGCDEAASRNFI
mgnify:FL=1